jgi:hypothetical protein
VIGGFMPNTYTYFYKEGPLEIKFFFGWVDKSEFVVEVNYLDKVQKSFQVSRDYLKKITTATQNTCEHLKNNDFNEVESLLITEKLANLIDAYQGLNQLIKEDE